MIRKGEAVEERRATIVACIFNDVATGVTVVGDEADDDAVKRCTKQSGHRPAALCRLSGGD